MHSVIIFIKILLLVASIACTLSDNATFKPTLRRQGLLEFEKVLRREDFLNKNLVSLFKITCFQRHTLLFFSRINWMEFKFFISFKYNSVVLK